MEAAKPLRTLDKMKSCEEATIVAIGDSLTYGWMVNKGYLDFLQEKFSEKYPAKEIQLINRGIPGDTAAGGLGRIESDVIVSNPDCVLIQFALNDAFMGYSQDQFAKNILLMIDKISQQTHADIVLVTSVWIKDPAFYSRAMAFYEQLEAIAADKGLPIARVHLYWKNKIDLGLEFRNLVQWDMVHPTVEGYKLMAEAIWEIFDIEKY